MMRHRTTRPVLLATMALTLTLSGCVAPVGPVEVSRFHLADTTMLGHGTIAVMPGPGMNPSSLEQQSYETAVAAALARLGYTTDTIGRGA